MFSLKKFYSAVINTEPWYSEAYLLLSFFLTMSMCSFVATIIEPSKKPWIFFAIFFLGIPLLKGLIEMYFHDKVCKKSDDYQKTEENEIEDLFDKKDDDIDLL